MWIESGDGESQPGEGALTLSDLADGMDEGEEAEEALPGGEDGEESELLEGEEEASDEDSDTEDSQEEPTVTLKHDGKEVSLKQSEVIELAQKGFDYTAKTMAVAEERKAVDAERAKVTEVRTQAEQELTETVNRLKAYSQFMESQVGTPPPIEWAHQDAAYYLAQKEQHEARKGQLQQAYAEIQRLEGEQARQRQARIAEKIESTEKALRDTLPGWNEATLQSLADYAGKLGLNPQSAEAAMLEPGFWQLAHKAAAFDALQAEKAKLKPKVELQKVAKPSQGHAPNRADAKRTEALKRHKAAPSIKTLMELGDF